MPCGALRLGRAHRSHRRGKREKRQPSELSCEAGSDAGLEEIQPGIKIARRNSNNLRYADDTTLMAESEEELSEEFKRAS